MGRIKIRCKVEAAQNATSDQDKGHQVGTRKVKTSKKRITAYSRELLGGAQVHALSALVDQVSEMGETVGFCDTIEDVIVEADSQFCDGFRKCPRPASPPPCECRS